MSFVERSSLRISEGPLSEVPLYTHNVSQDDLFVDTHIISEVQTLGTL